MARSFIRVARHSSRRADTPQWRWIFNSTVGRVWSMYILPGLPSRVCGLDKVEQFSTLITALVLAFLIWFFWDGLTPVAEGQVMDADTQKRLAEVLKKKELPPRKETERQIVDRWLRSYCLSVPEPCDPNNLNWKWEGGLPWHRY